MADQVDREVLRIALRQAVIDWLGPAYVGDKNMGSNPDYYQSRDVEELVAVLLTVIERIDG